VIDRSFGEGAAQAGNLAYLAMTALFPFFLVVAAIAGAVGRTDAGQRALEAFLLTLPADVADALAGPLAGLVEARSSDLVIFAVITGLFSISGFIQTLRDIVRRAYGAQPGSTLRHRLISIFGVVLVTLLLLAVFAFPVLLVGFEQAVLRLTPESMHGMARELGLYRLAPMAVSFAALWALFRLFTPVAWRPRGRCWPGALLTATVWMAATMLLPVVIDRVANYPVTYGSLAGVMITLLFFYIEGMGLVMGASLNAELAGARRPPRHGSAEQR
jgi:membrane protein